MHMRALKLKHPGSAYLDMTTGEPVRLILRFSLPLVVGNLLQQLYTFVDAAVIGNFVGLHAFAADSCASWVIWLINAVSRDSSNAFCIAASIRAGNKNTDELRKIIANAYLFAAALCIIVVTGLLTCINPILHLLNVQDAIFDQARTYLIIIILAMPFGISFHMTAALLRAVGNSDLTFYAIMTSTAVNIALDLLFVVVFRWSVAGAAIATLIAQVVSMCIVLAGARKNELFRLGREHWRVDGTILLEAVKLWAPMMVNSLVISIGGIFVQKAVNSIGAYFTAGIETSGTVFTMLEAIIMAIQAGACVFVGQNLGANQARRIRLGLHQILLAATGLTILLIALVCIFADPLVSVFLSKSDPEIYRLAHETGVRCTRVMICGMIIMTPMYLYRSALQTLGHPNYAMLAGFLQVAARILTVELLPGVIGEYAYYIPTLMAWLVTLPVVVIPYYVYMNRLCRKESGRMPQMTG